MVPTTGKAEGAAELAILPEVPRCAEGAVSTICVFNEEGCLVRRATDFKTPILVKDLPAGKVRVVSIPHVGREVGLVGEQVCKLKAGERTILRMPVSAVTAVPMRIRIVDSSNGPLSGHRVWCEDTMSVRQDNGETGITDSEGRLSVKGFAGREYRYIVRQADATERKRIPFRSVKTVSVPRKGDLGEMVWRLAVPGTVTLRLVRREAGKIVACTDVPSMYVAAVRPAIEGMSGCTVRAVEGEIVLPKGGPVARGGEALRVSISGADVRAKYRLESESVLLDETTDQIVNVVMVPLRYADVRFSSTNSQSRCYLASGRKAVVSLRPGQTKRVVGDRYQAVCWAPGSKIDMRELDLTSGKSASIECSAKAGAKHSGQVVDKDGKPVVGAQVRCRYSDILYVPTAKAESDGEGKFSLGADSSRERIVAVVTKMGGRLYRLKREEAGNIGRVQMEMPCTVYGTVRRAKKLALPAMSGFRTGRMRVFVFDASSPDLLLGEADVQDDGTFEMAVQPGRYSLVVFCTGEGVPAAELDVKKGQSRLDVGEILVNKELLKNAKGLSPRIK